MTSRTGESESPQAPPREQWSGQLGFLMAAIGSAIGLGNIWRFPGVAYTNGGGAFVVPYVIALLAAGLPILLLDYALGHRFRGSTPAVFRRMSSKLEWLGWFQVFICFVIMTYYAVVVAWSLRYMLFSVNIAWGDDAGGFFMHYIGADQLETEASYSPAVVAGVAIPLLFVWAFGLVVTALGVSGGVEKANKVFLPLLVCSTSSATSTRRFLVVRLTWLQFLVFFTSLQRLPSTCCVLLMQMMLPVSSRSGVCLHPSALCLALRMALLFVLVIRLPAASSISVCSVDSPTLSPLCTPSLSPLRMSIPPRV